MNKVEVIEKISDKGEYMVYMNGFISYKYLGFNCNGITLQHCRKQAAEYFIYVAKRRKYIQTKTYRILRKKKKKEIEEKNKERITRHRQWLRGGLKILNEIGKIK